MLNKCVTRLSLEWKLVSNLSEQSLGTQEGKTKAWKRHIKREAKKGLTKPALEKGKYNKMINLDKNFNEHET